MAEVFWELPQGQLTNVRGTITEFELD